ncbi:S-methyl-5-thioribose-1-phosphate isomerase [Desulfovibrio sp.]|uniref:S-methyl-5-thioribose-1-phosphate isomerase n=1 Tax=Desulfovibrio sp. TaxID=885 RepID=UPI0023D559E8|nr:S-methyl-5-thioribose-1-phosphate isomerase [Desulfovibrio sp.]MDE7241693.1 S-methyl-5-thioribose-1-phosphate isomerase [Desulfovibrio sp.]
MDSHIRFDAREGVLHLLDQRRLPEVEADVACRTPDEVVDALKTMVVRGAPAIGVTAAFGCALAARRAAAETGADARKRLEAEFDHIARARPTAVNLGWAVARMRGVLAAAEARGALSPEEIVALLDREAYTLQREDEALCRRLGHFGAELLHDGDQVLTHCNAGALATAGYGTALGVIRAAVGQGKRIRVIADETRPFLQGARLTAWELARDGIPVTVACDNACAHLMSRGMVQAVVVGADRIAANGDTANKIGTLGVAILAGHFHVPFYVAAPLSTIDAATPDGAAIPIEERPAEEVTHMGGRRITPGGVPVLNFAFDVTPAALVAGIITEAGVLRAPYGEAIARALATRGGEGAR